MRTPRAPWVGLLAATCILTACAGNGGAGGGGSKPPACVPPRQGASVSFSGDVQPIFNRSCALQGCHTAATQSGNLDLTAGTSYDEVVNVPSSQQPNVKRVARGSPDDSYVVRKIIGEPGTISGAPMPLGCPTPPPGGECLGSDDLSCIEQWITECALNN